MADHMRGRPRASAGHADEKGALAEKDEGAERGGLSGILWFLGPVVGAVLVAHNADFDVKFMRTQAKPLDYYFRNRVIDTVQLYLKKLQLEANMKSVDGQQPDIVKQVAATKEQIVQAERECDRIANLLRVDAANQKQLDDAETMLEVLRKQLDAQNSSLQNSSRSLAWQSSSVGIQVAQVDDQLKKSRVCSPITGTVLAKYAEEGELAAPGTPLFKVADMEQIYLRAYVTSRQLSRIKLGQQLAVYADYGEDVRHEYQGVVTWISDTAEFTPKMILTEDERANQVYAVRIAVRNDGMLKIGMYGGLYLPEGE